MKAPFETKNKYRIIEMFREAKEQYRSEDYSILFSGRRSITKFHGISGSEPAVLIVDQSRGIMGLGVELNRIITTKRGYTLLWVASKHRPTDVVELCVIFKDEHSLAISKWESTGKLTEGLFPTQLNADYEADEFVTLDQLVEEALTTDTEQLPEPISVIDAVRTSRLDLFPQYTAETAEISETVSAPSFRFSPVSLAKTKTAEDLVFKIKLLLNEENGEMPVLVSDGNFIVIKEFDFVGSYLGHWHMIVIYPDYSSRTLNFPHAYNFLTGDGRVIIENRVYNFGTLSKV